MATYGQYQSFALIAYDAFARQLKHVNSQIAKGCNDDGCTETLYVAKNVIDTIFSYSTECISVTNLTEPMILKLCNWIARLLNFTTAPIGQLTPTYLNTKRDFQSSDFNVNDFA
jgi:hypothetical protein